MRADDEGVWCACGGQMRAEEGRKFPGNRRWLWWRCPQCDRTTPGVPLPLRRQPHDMADLQSDPTCTDPTSTALHGTGSGSAYSHATVDARRTTV